MATPCDARTGDGAHFTSGGSYRTVETVVAFAYYNIGIPNNEMLGASWNKPDSRN